MTDTPSGRNIVLLLVDQLAARWLETALERDIVPLPGVRRLMAHGVTFERAYTVNPVCSPARATLFTGLTPTAHGLTECGYRLDPSVPTVARTLRDNGYHTGAFGKVHLIPIIEDPQPDYRPYGFEVQHITEDGRIGEWVDWVRSEHPEWYHQVLATVWMTMTDHLDTMGPDGADLRAQILAAQAELTFDPIDGHDQDWDSYVLPFPAEVSQTHWITERAIDFLREQQPGQPFFAQVSYVQPHNPFSPPAEYLDCVDRHKIPAPVPAEWSDREGPAYFDQERYPDPSYEVRDWQRDRWFYFADLAHLDAQFVRLLDELDALGLADNTTVIFTSDHGELLHDHGLLGKWERHYDACVRVPLIVAGPDAPSGQRVGRVVDHLSVVPTIHDIAGIGVPLLPRPDIGGTRVPRDIPLFAAASLLADGAERERTTVRPDGGVLVASNNSHMEASPRSWARTVVTARYRYTRYLAGGGEQLFDLIEDPDEQHNLLDAGATPPTSQVASVRDELRDLLFELVVRDGYPNSPRELYGIGTW